MLNDCNRDISGYMEEMSFSEESFQEVQSRLDEINRLKGKYGDSIEAILGYRKQQQAQLDGLLHMEERKERLSGELEKAKKSWNRPADN